MINLSVLVFVGPLDQSLRHDFAAGKLCRMVMTAGCRQAQTALLCRQIGAIRALFIIRKYRHGVPFTCADSGLLVPCWTERKAKNPLRCLEFTYSWQLTSHRAAREQVCMASAQAFSYCLKGMNSNTLRLQMSPLPFYKVIKCSVLQYRWVTKC